MRGNSTIGRFSGAPVSRRSVSQVARLRRAEHVGLVGGDELDLDAALHGARERGGEPAVAEVRHLDGERVLRGVDQREPVADHRAAVLAVRLAAVHEEVEAARRIELVVAGHALAQARDVLGPLGLDHHVDPVVAVVVADAHRAEREVAIVDDVELAVIEALARVLDGDVRVREDALGERVRLLLERAGRAVHGAEEPRLEPADRIDALVEEALLVAAGVLVDRRDPVLVDHDLRAAVGGGEHGLAQEVAGLVVAPQERADLDGAARRVRTRSRIAWNAVSPEPSTRRPPVTGWDGARRGEAGSPAGATGVWRVVDHEMAGTSDEPSDLLRVTRSARSCNGTRRGWQRPADRCEP